MVRVHADVNHTFSTIIGNKFKIGDVEMKYYYRQARLLDMVFPSDLKTLRILGDPADFLLSNPAMWRKLPPTIEVLEISEKYSGKLHLKEFPFFKNLRELSVGENCKIEIDELMKLVKHTFDRYGLNLKKVQIGQRSIEIPDFWDDVVNFQETHKKSGKLFSFLPFEKIQDVFYKKHCFVRVPVTNRDLIRKFPTEPYAVGSEELFHYLPFPLAVVFFARLNPFERNKMLAWLKADLYIITEKRSNQTPGLDIELFPKDRLFLPQKEYIQLIWHSKDGSIDSNFKYTLMINLAFLTYGRLLDELTKSLDSLLEDSESAAGPSSSSTIKLNKVTTTSVTLSTPAEKTSSEPEIVIPKQDSNTLSEKCKIQIDVLMRLLTHDSPANLNDLEDLKHDSPANLNDLEDLKHDSPANLNDLEDLKHDSPANLNDLEDLKHDSPANLNDLEDLKHDSPANLNDLEDLKHDSPANLNTSNLEEKIEQLESEKETLARKNKSLEQEAESLRQSKANLERENERKNKSLEEEVESLRKFKAKMLRHHDWIELKTSQRHEQEKVLKKLEKENKMLKQDIENLKLREGNKAGEQNGTAFINMPNLSQSQNVASISTESRDSVSVNHNSLQLQQQPHSYTEFVYVDDIRFTQRSCSHKFTLDQHGTILERAQMLANMSSDEERDQWVAENIFVEGFYNTPNIFSFLSGIHNEWVNQSWNHSYTGVNLRDVSEILIQSSRQRGPKTTATEFWSFNNRRIVLIHLTRRLLAEKAGLLGSDSCPIWNPRIRVKHAFRPTKSAYETLITSTSPDGSDPLSQWFYYELNQKFDTTDELNQIRNGKSITVREPRKPWVLKIDDNGKWQ